ncbi:MAG TPA: aminotransferase [Spirochaetia bacterium]|nr:MAG: aminotransferase [Spirochaetes bacterium GWB1_36_13]HCL56151.1 aminotransferase [Spirochaetia bacterium]
MTNFKKSNKLANVCYDIRGEVLAEADRLEKEGYRILKLNIGNPAPFGLDAPDEILHDMIINLKNAQGYSDSKGIFSGRKAIMQDCQLKNIPNVTIDDIYTGNGVSELIQMSMQALLDEGDEVLVPAPDYPLWTASINLATGKAVHYFCDEESDWIPDIKDIERKISPKTKAIVVINPNNPTGAVYPKEILLQIVNLAALHGLIVFSDEIYEKIIYDEAVHIPLATLSDDVFFVTFNGISKSHRSAGFRAGWMILSGRKELAADYIEGLNILSGMRLCSNVPAQFAIQTALGGHQSLTELIKPGGRIYEQRKYSVEALNKIPGISCVNPKGAFYLFPKIDAKKFKIHDDKKFVYDFLVKEKVLLVQGTGFNWPNPDHFRVVFLPNIDVLKEAYGKLEHFLKDYQQESFI